MNWLTRLLCRHEDTMKFEVTTVYLQCLHCGRRTPGWTIKSSAQAREEREERKKVFDELMEVEMGLGTGG